MKNEYLFSITSDDDTVFKAIVSSKNNYVVLKDRYFTHSKTLQKLLKGDYNLNLKDKDNNTQSINLNSKDWLSNLKEYNQISIRYGKNAIVEPTTNIITFNLKYHKCFSSIDTHIYYSAKLNSIKSLYNYIGIDIVFKHKNNSFECKIYSTDDMQESCNSIENVLKNIQNESLVIDDFKDDFSIKFLDKLSFLVSDDSYDQLQIKINNTTYSIDDSGYVLLFNNELAQSMKKNKQINSNIHKEISHIPTKKNNNTEILNRNLTKKSSNRSKRRHIEVNLSIERGKKSIRERRVPAHHSH